MVTLTVSPARPESLHADNPNAFGHILHPSLADCTRAMTEKSFELTDEEFTQLLRSVDEASRGGYPFDAFTVALLLVLARQMQDDDLEPEDLENVDDDLMSMENTDDVEMTSWSDRKELNQMARADNSRRRLGQNVKGFTTTPDAPPTLAEIITGRNRR